MLDDSAVEKRNATINYVQYGIDLYHMALGGASWPSNGGYGNGRKLPLTFAAVLLATSGMKNIVMANTDNSIYHLFGEDGHVAIGQNNIPLWGAPYDSQTSCSEFVYWRNIVLDTGDRDCKDPHGYIDGGLIPGGSYQSCCNSKLWKGPALSLHLMPELKQVWNYDSFLDYVDRWVNLGAYTQPDLCAPPTGLCINGNNVGASCTNASESTICTGGGTCDLSAKWSADYGVLYGPDGSGGCILDSDSSDGVGRFPTLHGTNVDGGGYSSTFATQMWDTYRAGAGGGTCTLDLECDDSISCTIDTCNAGTCTNLIDNNLCSSLNDDCNAGTCDLVQECIATPTNEGGTCNDNNACTTTTTCTAGTCGGGTTTTQCINNDGCCPVGCDNSNDNDCQLGVTSFYNFDEGSGGIVNDVSGNGNNGAITGATWTINGKNAGGLSFDGNDYVNFGDIDLSGPFTLMHWMNPSDLSGSYQSTLMKRLNFGFEFNSNIIEASIGNGVSWSATASGTLSGVGIWDHLAMSYDGTTLSFYINGNLVDTATGTYTSGDNPLLMGAWTTGSEFYKGTIDDARIYSRALSQIEIQSDMNTPVGGATCTNNLECDDSIACTVDSCNAGACINDNTNCDCTLADTNGDTSIDVLDLVDVIVNNVDVTSDSQSDIFDLVFVATRFNVC